MPTISNVVKLLHCQISVGNLPLIDVKEIENTFKFVKFLMELLILPTKCEALYMYKTHKCFNVHIESGSFCSNQMWLIDETNDLKSVRLPIDSGKQHHRLLYVAKLMHKIVEFGEESLHSIVLL